MKMQSAKQEAEEKLEVHEVRHSFRIQQLQKEETSSLWYAVGTDQYLTWLEERLIRVYKLWNV